MLKRVAAFLCWLALVLPASAQFFTAPANTPPPQAVAAGYNTLTFTSTFVPATVDTGRTYASGFKWYVTDFFNAAQTNPAPITFNGDGTAVIYGNVDIPGVVSQIATAGLTSQGSGSAPWVGTAFGGGAYFEGVFKFNPSLVDQSMGEPTFFGMSIEHNANLSGQQWAGQVAGYHHFIEVDILEFFPSLGCCGISTAVHDWYARNNVECFPNGYCNVTSQQTKQGFNYNNYHRFGALWIPATGSTNGSLTYYVDNVAVYGPIVWSQFTTQSPPPVPTWTFGIIDQQHLVMQLGTGVGAPVTLQSFNVWQTNSAGNLVQ